MTDGPRWCIGARVARNAVRRTRARECADRRTTWRSRTVRVRAPGRSAVTVMQRATGARGVNRAAYREGSAHCASAQSIRCRCRCDRWPCWSDTINISVAERPFLGDVSIRAIFRPISTAARKRFRRARHCAFRAERARLRRHVVDRAHIRASGWRRSDDRTRPDVRRFSGRFTRRLAHA